MNHYCTYFDSGFLIQGLALWQSLRSHDAESVLWVLALDAESEAVLIRAGDERLRVVSLGRLESDDPELKAVKARRSRAEYYFTLTPCWPRWLLETHPEVEGITCLDADIFFFSSPGPMFAEVTAAGASVGITAHRFPAELRSYEKWGRYNVGVQVFRNDGPGREVLNDWREKCLEWCHDRLEGERFADQKYLDAWPERFGAAVHVIAHQGVNVAPWNWMRYVIAADSSMVSVSGQPLIAFHFARFRPVGWGLWDSGQVEFGVMPRKIRNVIYGRYWRALEEVRHGLLLSGKYGYRKGTLRNERSGWRNWLMRLGFGPLWWRVAGSWLAFGCGPLGRFSGSLLARWRSERGSA